MTPLAGSITDGDRQWAQRSRQLERSGAGLGLETQFVELKIDPPAAPVEQQVKAHIDRGAQLEINRAVEAEPQIPGLLLQVDGHSAAEAEAILESQAHALGRHHQLQGIGIDTRQGGDPVLLQIGEQAPQAGVSSRRCRQGAAAGGTAQVPAHVIADTQQGIEAGELADRAVDQRQRQRQGGGVGVVAVAVSLGGDIGLEIADRGGGIVDKIAKRAR